MKVFYAILCCLLLSWSDSWGTIVKYVAASPSGDASGSSAINAADFLNNTFWSEVQQQLRTEPVTVKFSAGDYHRAYTEKGFVLDSKGHFQNTLTLEGEAGNTIFNVPTGISNGSAVVFDIRNSVNIVLKNFRFTGNGSVNYVLRITSTAAKYCRDIVVENCTWEDMRGIVYGATGCHYEGTFNITYKNCTFKRIGLNSGSHMIYNAYDSHHISVINSNFEDCTGEYVRFRDNCDYGVVDGSRFVRNSSFPDYAFISMPLFNDVNPGDEIFGTHYSFTNNTFSNVSTATLFYSSGYDSVGRKYLLTASEGAILTGGTSLQKKNLLLSNFGIDTEKIRYHNNTYTGITYKMRLGSVAAYGSVSKGWTGYANISDLIGGTIDPLSWEIPVSAVAAGEWKNTSTPWIYDFSTATAAGATQFTSGSSVSTSGSRGFLPYPPTGNGRVSIPSSGAKFTLLSDALRVHSSGSSNPAKFSLYNIPGATSITSLFFTISFNDSNFDNSVWTVAFGNSDGASNILSNSSSVTTSGTTSNPELFGVFRWEVAKTAPTIVNFQYREKKSATASAAFKLISSSFFQRGGQYKMEIYSNNHSSDQKYIRGGIEYLVAPGTYHIWANGTQMKLGVSPAFPVNEMALGITINSLMIYGTNSETLGIPDNQAEATVSSIKINISSITLPVSIASFTGKKSGGNTLFNWVTVSESNNSHFEILRSPDGKDFTKIGTISGHGNSNEQHRYDFVDEMPLPGINYYRLVQVDFDGTTSSYDKIVSIDNNLLKEDFSLFVTHQKQLNASFYSTQNAKGVLQIIDVSGRRLKEYKLDIKSGNNQIAFPTDLTPGVYIGVINNGRESKRTKFNL